MLKILFYAVLLLLFVLLFVSGANDASSRLEKALWDTGHLFLFSGLALLMVNSHYLKKRPFIQQFFFLLCLSLGLGFGIEFAQLNVGRYFELNDVLFDLLGAALGLLLYIIYHSQQRFNLFLKFLPLILVIVFLVFKPVFIAYQDRRLMQQDFPVLADFESAAELGRWRENNVHIYRQTQRVAHGQSALGIAFVPAQYPGLALREFNGDWRAYQYLKFSLFNAQSNEQHLLVKIYDRIHPQNAYKDNDRFNVSLQLKPGWNYISLRLDDVRQAPLGRDMDMANIVDLSLFLLQPERPVKMYLDHLRLSH